MTPRSRLAALLISLAAPLGAALPLLAVTSAQAQDATPIKFQLDWRFEGPAALFLVPEAKGYNKAEKLAVTIDAGNGSGGTITRVASGVYDMGFADMASLMEFQANYPAAPNKPIAVMMVYNNTPAAVMALKKSGIRKPADLKGKKLGAPVFDAGRRGWPIFAKANGLDAADWTTMDPTLRETMLIRGDVDAITGFTFTSLLNLEARGVKASDVEVLAYPAYGVKLYGNAIIVSDAFLKKNPEAVKAFLRAFTKGLKDVIADPKDAVAVLKAKDGLVNAAIEEKRLRMALDATVLTPDARAEGFGNVMAPRLSLMASQVSDAYATRNRVDPAAVWTPAYLPPMSDRDIFRTARR